jgi:hypothetical protein
MPAVGAALALMPLHIDVSIRSLIGDLAYRQPPWKGCALGCPRLPWMRRDCSKQS